MRNLDDIIQELEVQFTEESELAQAFNRVRKDHWEYVGAVSFLSIDGEEIDGDNIYIGGSQLRLDEFNKEGDMWDQPFLDGLVADFFEMQQGLWGDSEDNTYRITIERVDSNYE